jgi:hypothetical protein
MTQEITRRELIKKFLLFLKENDALDKFKKNIKAQKKYEFKTLENNINIFSILTFKPIFESGYYREFINFGVSWSETPEGTSYWANLDIKWRKMLDRNSVKIISEKIYE